jgi:hypothetical protein
VTIFKLRSIGREEQSCNSLNKTVWNGGEQSLSILAASGHYINI